MEQKNPKFRLRLNLFDGIVLVLALAVGAFLVWNTLKPDTTPVGEPKTATVQYTIRFQRMIEGTGSLVQVGETLVDTVKNFDVGQVVSVEIVPAQVQMYDRVNGKLKMSTVPGYEDAIVTVEAACTQSDQTLTVGGGYDIHVGATTYVRGKGYMGSGPIVDIDREGLK